MDLVAAAGQRAQRGELILGNQGDGHHSFHHCIVDLNFLLFIHRRHLAGQRSACGCGEVIQEVQEAGILIERISQDRFVLFEGLFPLLGGLFGGGLPLDQLGHRLDLRLGVVEDIAGCLQTGLLAHIFAADRGGAGVFFEIRILILEILLGGFLQILSQLLQLFGAYAFVPRLVQRLLRAHHGVKLLGTGEQPLVCLDGRGQQLFTVFLSGGDFVMNRFVTDHILLSVIAQGHDGSVYRKVGGELSWIFENAFEGGVQEGERVGKGNST